MCIKHRKATMHKTRRTDYEILSRVRQAASKAKQVLSVLRSRLEGNATAPTTESLQADKKVNEVTIQPASADEKVNNLADKAGKATAAAVVNIAKGVAQTKEGINNTLQSEAAQNAIQSSKTLLGNLDNSTLHLIKVGLALLVGVSVFMPFYVINGFSMHVSVNYIYDNGIFARDGQIMDGIFVLIAMVVYLITALMNSAHPRKPLGIINIVCAAIPLLLAAFAGINLTQIDYSEYISLGFGYWIMLLADIALMVLSVLSLMRHTENKTA